MMRLVRGERAPYEGEPLRVPQPAKASWDERELSVGVAQAAWASLVALLAVVGETIPPWDAAGWTQQEALINRVRAIAHTGTATAPGAHVDALTQHFDALTNGLLAYYRQAVIVQSAIGKVRTR